MQLPQSFDPRLAIQQAGTERLVARPQPELLQRDWSCSHALALAGSRRLGPQKWRQGLEQLVSSDLRRASVGSSTVTSGVLLLHGQAYSACTTCENGLRTAMISTGTQLS